MKPDARSTKVEVRFNGPTHRLEAFGQTVKRGETALFDRAEIFSLQAQPRIDIEVLGKPAAGDGEGQHPTTHKDKE